MSDSIHSFELTVTIQENGIVRDPQGWIIGRVDKDWEEERMALYDHARADEPKSKWQSNGEQADSREKLEADVRRSLGFTVDDVFHWLDRQANISWNNAWKVQKDLIADMQAKVDDLTAERDELDEMRERYARALNQIADALGVEITDDAETHVREMAAIEKLTAERDRLRRFVDGGAYDCMTCEAKAELAERADSLEAELKRKQHVIDVQRDSFLKLEVENAELRRALDGASDALESI